MVDGEITRIDPSVASMTLSVRIAEPGRSATLQVATFTRNSRVFMSADDLLTRCAAELAEDAARVVIVQEAAVARDQGIARAVAHHRKVFLTPDTLEPGTYEFVKDISGGKSFYGTVRQALNAFASEVAEPEGVDAVMDLERWFRPTGLAWAAPRAGGKGVVLKDPCNFDPSRYRGDFYPKGDDADYDPPLSARCAPSSPAVQGLARLQGRDNDNIFAGSAPIPVPKAAPASPVNATAATMPSPSVPSTRQACTMDQILHDEEERFIGRADQGRVRRGSIALSLWISIYVRPLQMLGLLFLASCAPHIITLPEPRPLSPEVSVGLLPGKVVVSSKTTTSTLTFETPDLQPPPNWRPVPHDQHAREMDSPTGSCNPKLCQGLSIAARSRGRRFRASRHPSSFRDARRFSRMRY